MLKYLFFIITLCLIVSCSKWFGNEKDEYINIYKDIFIVRLRYIDDSLKVKPEILKIYEKYGYTEQTFSEKFKEYESNPEELLILLDSARERAKKEILGTQIQK